MDIIIEMLMQNKEIAGGSGVSGLVSLWLAYRMIFNRGYKKGLKDGEDRRVLLRAEELRRIVSKNQNIIIDSTKRKSLQPSNQQPLPQGFDDYDAVKDIAKVETNIKQQNKVSGNVKPTKPLEKPFEHMFYGTMLIVNDKILIKGLNKQKHRLEVIGDQLFIDNKLYDKISASSVETIKALIRKSRQQG